MIAETSLLMEKHRLVTIPANIKSKMLERGWKDGKVFMEYNESTDSVKIIRADKLDAVIRKGNADGEIRTKPAIYKHIATLYPTKGGGGIGLPGVPT